MKRPLPHIIAVYNCSAFGLDAKVYDKIYGSKGYDLYADYCKANETDNLETEILDQSEFRRIDKSKYYEINKEKFKEYRKINKDKILENGNLNDIGKIMHEHWQYKKERSKFMTNNKINHLYNIAINNGALGGKLIGAGGGGFLMFYSVH